MSETTPDPMPMPAPAPTNDSGPSPESTVEIPPVPIPPREGPRLVLTDEDFIMASRILNCTVAAIKAVAEVESKGEGFLPSGRPVILYEAHVFHRLTQGAHATALDRYGAPLSVPRWNRSLYGRGGEHQHLRLADAARLNADAAIQACSWGQFQIMGENYYSLGYYTLNTFVSAMQSAPGQLDAFVRFIHTNKLATHLRTLDWSAFAARYNGPAYAENQYDVKMARAFARINKSR